MDRPRMPLFYRIAIIFSFMFNLVTIAVLIALPFLLRPILGRLMGELDRLENAVIETVVPVDQSMPVQGVAIHLRGPVQVRTTSGAPVSRAAVTMYLQGGYISGSADIVLPEGMELPITFTQDVVMTTTIPVRLAIPVAIPLHDTQVGTFAANLKAMLEPIWRVMGGE
ncbi:MAG: hypothetical protein ACP5OO_09275 [Chloroflexia bacterium]